MRKFLMTSLIAVALFFVVNPAFAWIVVGDYGDTGWQTFNYTFDQDWSGQVGFLVSNYDNTAGDSVLLVDNLDFGADNESFEAGDLANFTAEGDVSVVSSFSAASGTVYTPTNDEYMARLLSSGIGTSAFGGTDGSVLWLDAVLEFEEGDEVSFDWAFLAMDYMPYEDFSLLLHRDAETQILDWDELGRIGVAGVVPEPASMALMGIGLLGLARRLRKKQ